MCVNSKQPVKWPHCSEYGVCSDCCPSLGIQKWTRERKWAKRLTIWVKEKRFGEEREREKKKVVVKIISSTTSYLNHYWVLFGGNVLLPPLMYSLSAPEQSIPVHLLLPSEVRWHADVKEQLNGKHRGTEPITRKIMTPVRKVSTNYEWNNYILSCSLKEKKKKNSLCSFHISPPLYLMCPTKQQLSSQSWPSGGLRKVILLRPCLPLSSSSFSDWYVREAGPWPTPDLGKLLWPPCAFGRKPDLAHTHRGAVAASSDPKDL